MRFVKFLILPLFISLNCLGIARAQEAAEPTTRMDVPAEKRTLIKEILDLTNSRKSSEEMFSAQFNEMEKQMPDIQWRAISSLDEFKKLTPAQQADVHEKVLQSSARRSHRIKELFLQRIDLKQIIEDISYRAYDKHFTEQELKDLLAFYRSDTGKKVVAEMPALFAESIAKVGEIIEPEVARIVEETQQDQTSELQHEVDALLKASPKAPPKKAATSRRRP